MVSPYLLRPRRSYEEVASEQPPNDPMIERVIRRALAEAEATGKGHYDQIDRAAVAVLGQYPEMSGIEALAAVQRVKRWL